MIKMSFYNMMQKQMQMENDDFEKYMDGKCTSKPVIQIRRVSEAGSTIAHIQGLGSNKNGNRPYGMAEQFFVEPEFTDWLAEQEDGYESFASGGKMCYMRNVTLTRYDDGTQMVVQGKAGNTDKGYIVAFSKDSIRIRRFLKWAEDNYLVETIKGNMPRFPKEE